MAEQREPFLGVPKGDVKVLTPDGTYRGDYTNHSLYDTGPLPQPTIPGDFDVERPATTRR